MPTKRLPFIKSHGESLTPYAEYDYSGGLDTETPDEHHSRPRQFQAVHMPYIRNARVYASNTLENRVPISTRKGPSFYSVPLGETIDQTQISVTGAANQSFGLVSFLAFKIVPTITGRLTKVDLNLKNTASATGPVIVKIYSSVAGAPATVLAQSSILSSSITSSYQYLSARFIEAPQVTASTIYWGVVSIQDDGTNTYQMSSTTTVTTALTSANSGVTWSASTFGLNFKTYISTDKPTLGLSRAYRSTGSPVTLIASGTTLNTINDVTGATTAISTGLTSTATDYYFEYANDTAFYVNGKDAPRKWDFTTDAVAAGSPGVSSLIILHKNRMFYVQIADPARVVFTDAGDFATIQGVSFLYVPTPKSTDPIVSMFISQDNLVFATRKSKWVLYGADLASFQLRHAVSTVGTVSHNTVAEYKGKHYFLSDDGVYVFNGSFDQNISDVGTPWRPGITREIRGIADKTKCVATIWNGQYRLYYPSSGSAVNNRCLIYEIEKGSWWMDDNVYVGRTAIWGKSPDSNQLLEASSLVGAAYYAEQGYNDLGRSIDFEMRLHYNPFGQPPALKRVKKYRPEFRSTSGNYSVDCQYDKDYAGAPISNFIYLQGAGYVLGSATPLLGAITLGKTQFIKGRISVSGKFNYLQYRYKCFGVNKPVELLGSTSLYQTGRIK